MVDYWAKFQALATKRDIGSMLNTMQGQIKTLQDAPAGSSVWGSITGTLSDQTDLQSAIDAKLTKGTSTAAQIDSHLASTSNPHSVDKTDVGLSNVPNPDSANTTDYLRRDGTWAVPPGSGGGAATVAPAWWQAVASDGVTDYMGYTWRVGILGADLKASGGKVRIWFQPHGTVNTVLDHVSIVERDGTTSNGTTTPTEVTFSSASGVTLTAGGARVASDWITFTVDETKNYLIIYDMNASVTSKLRYSSATGVTGYYKSATASWDQQNLGGATTRSNECEVLTMIQVKAA